MDAEGFANLCILMATWVLPYLLFVAGNSFRSAAVTLVRALFAIGAGWCMVVTHAVSARAIAMSVASSSERLRLYDVDGAPLAFASVLGWVPGALVVLVAWSIHSSICRRGRIGAGCPQQPAASRGTA